MCGVARAACLTPRSPRALRLPNIEEIMWLWPIVVKNLEVLRGREADEVDHYPGTVSPRRYCLAFCCFGWTLASETSQITANSVITRKLQTTIPKIKISSCTNHKRKDRGRKPFSYTGVASQRCCTLVSLIEQ